jgi:hypothetical protein
MTTEPDYCVFTVCNIAYLPKALVLADSLRRHAGKQLKVVLFDRKRTFKYPVDAVDITWVEDLGVERWEELAFLYDIIEFTTSLKAYIASSLLKRHEKVIFLDPDTCVYASLRQILTDLDTYPILVTPHYTTPQPSTRNESDLAMMRFGSFNLGFFGVRRSRDSQAFLDWWHRRCLDFCFMESQFGLSTDQKWVSIAPCLFEALKVSFNLGYNMAPWNTFERSVTRTSAGNAYIVNERFPLVFFHFSNFDPSDPQYINKRASCESGVMYPTLLELGEDYAEWLSETTQQVETVRYSFDYMSDGSYISPTLRRAYASIRDDLVSGHNPFDSNGQIGAFARRNHLVSDSTTTVYKYPTMRQAAKHGRVLAGVHGLMRVLLRLVSPNRFYDLTKLFVYLSCLRLQRGMWKL